MTITEAQLAHVIRVRERGGLSMFTVYANPSDFPGQHVARHSATYSGGRLEVDREPWVVAPTLAEVRDALPHEELGLVCLSRQPGDQPHIVEMWL